LELAGFDQTVTTNTAITKPMPSDLGFYADAVEAHPIATLTATGVAVGLVAGAAFGLAVGALFRQDLGVYAVRGAGVWSAILGIKGWQEGQNLKSWLASSQ
jgi:hypothetical protein